MVALIIPINNLHAWEHSDWVGIINSSRPVLEGSKVFTLSLRLEVLRYYGLRH